MRVNGRVVSAGGFHHQHFATRTARAVNSGCASMVVRTLVLRTINMGLIGLFPFVAIIDEVHNVKWVIVISELESRAVDRC